MLKKYDKLCSGAFFLLISVIMLSQLSSIKIMDIAMDSRLFPTIIIIFLAIIGLALVSIGLLELRHKKCTTKIKWDKAVLRNTVILVLLYAAFVAMLPTLGFMVSGSFFLLTTFLLLSPRKKWNIPIFIFISILVPVGVYYLFSYGFRMLLPLGKIWG